MMISSSNMSSWTWVARTLKKLKLSANGPSSVNQGNNHVAQSRLPPLMSAQAAAVETFPEKPKRPMSAYLRYADKIRDEVRRENPALKATEIMKRIGTRWGTLDESSKDVYKKAFKKDMESYSVLLRKYNDSLTPEQKSLQQELKVQKQLEKEKREKRRRVKELGKPKKPLSGFLQFLFSKYPPGTAMSVEQQRNAAKNVAVQWKNMSESEKQPFVRKYQDEIKKYEKELLAWEQKMMEMGHTDLVRLQRFEEKDKSSKSKRKQSENPK